MKGSWILLLAFVSSALSSVIDVFEAINGHEPRVAVRCGKIPYFIDVKTGHWILDPDQTSVCDTNKEDVKKYCQKVYGKLNITNIVDANDDVKFDQWCDPVKKSCEDGKKVTPYRCLVQEYEADALMVPRDCKFDHMHDERACMTKQEWKRRAEGRCVSENKKLKEYGVLLSCATDMFTGIEYVCCPKEEANRTVVATVQPEKVDLEGLERAIGMFQKYLPTEKRGCDRSQYEGKRDRLEERHRKRIAAVVDEWDEAERRYKQLKKKDLHSAEEKIRRTLQVFRETLAALEQEAKEERQRLRDDHAECIKMDIEKKKRDAMIEYIASVEEKPYTTARILKTVRKFIQTCEHDRLHSLRHFEHVRNQDPMKAKAMRTSLLNHLKELNNVVNISINLLSYLPKVAHQFGLTHASDGVILKPRVKAPEVVKIEPHQHDELPSALTKSLPPPPPPTPVAETFEIVPTEAPTPVHEEHHFVRHTASPSPLRHKERGHHKRHGHKKEHHKKHGHHKKEEHHKKHEHHKKEEHHKKHGGHHKRHGHHKHHGKHGVIQKPTDVNRVPKKAWMMEGTKQPVEPKPNHVNSNKILELPASKSKGKLKYGKEGLPEQEHDPSNLKGRGFFRRPRSPAAFAAVIGLSCGALVIMLGIIVALVMRRNRQNQGPRVVLTDAGDDDREHLVKMQKNGYENPTYKFFYY